MKLGNDYQMKKDSSEDRMLLLCLALKCADISNVCKPKQIYLEWTHRLVEEVDLDALVCVKSSVLSTRRPRTQTGATDICIYGQREPNTFTIPLNFY